MHTKLIFIVPIILFLGIVTGSFLLEAVTPNFVPNIVPDVVARIVPVKEEVKKPIDFSVIFFGDIMLGRHVEFLMQQNGAYYPFLHVAAMTASSTFAVGNFESAMAPAHIRTPSGGFTFSVDPQFLTGLASSGITHVSLANNHALDYGVAGYTHAKTELAKHGIDSFGHARNIASSSVTYLSHDDVTIGIIGIHTLFVKPDEAGLTKIIDDMKRNSDIQIAYVHWGDEYEPVHNTAQEALAQVLVRAGIDTVIGHHPHVVQDIGNVDGVPVFYSLGNFIFDQYFSQAVQIGYALKLNVQEDALVYTIQPITSINSRSKPRLMEGEEIHQFLTELADKSDQGYRDYIKQGKLIIPFDLAKS